MKSMNIVSISLGKLETMLCLLFFFGVGGGGGGGWGGEGVNKVLWDRGKQLSSHESSCLIQTLMTLRQSFIYQLKLGTTRKAPMLR